MTKSGIGTAATGVLALALMAAAGQALAFPHAKYATSLDDFAAAKAAAPAINPAANAAVQAVNAAAANRPPVVVPTVGPVAAPVASAPEAEPVMRAAPAPSAVVQSSLLAPAAARPRPVESAPAAVPFASDPSTSPEAAEPLARMPVETEWSNASAAKHTADKKPAAKKAEPQPEKRKLVGYTVHGGDTLSGVGRRFGVPVKEIASLNGLDGKGGGIRPGETLKLPASARDNGADPHAKGEPVFGPPVKVAAAKPAPKYIEKPAGPRMQVASAAHTSLAPQPVAPPPPVATPAHAPVEIRADVPHAASMRPTAPQDGPFAPVTAPPGAPITGAATPPPPPPQPVAVAHANSGGPLSIFKRQPKSDDGSPASLGRGRFVWPVRGEVVSRFGMHGAGQQNDGLNIGAAAGSGVKAAAGGEVVYAGNSLPDFGNMVLIKHPDGWVTAYGHLASIEVKMRETVAQGQEIGRVGQTGAVDRPQLHFEIRYSANAREKAKPLDPSLILP